MRTGATFSEISSLIFEPHVSKIPSYRSIFASIGYHYGGKYLLKAHFVRKFFVVVYLMMKNNLKLNNYAYNTYIKIPTQNNLREDEIRGATSIIGFLLSLFPVSDSSCNRLCDKGHVLENYVFFPHFR